MSLADKQKRYVPPDWYENQCTTCGTLNPALSAETRPNTCASCGRPLFTVAQAGRNLYNQSIPKKDKGGRPRKKS